MTNTTTATEILNQIGNKALMMLGALNYGATDNSLSFKIRGSKTVSHINIELNSMDLYDVTFIKIRGTNFKEVEKCEGIYSDMLHNAIERVTGLYTSL